MDPALQELFEGDASEEIEAIVKLVNPHSVPRRIRPISDPFGSILTCRVERQYLREVWNHPDVVSFKAPRLLATEAAVLDPEATLDLEIPGTDQRRPSTMPFTGAGVVVAFIDSGCDFANANFRHADGTTRLLAFWDQSGSGAACAEPYGYGVEHLAPKLNRALASPDPYAALGYFPPTSAHGTLVMDIAAGNGRAPGTPVGVAPNADLVFVHVSTGALSGEAGLGDSVRLLEAIDYVRRVASGRPVGINMSLGRRAGSHDGLSLGEQAMDAFCLEAPGRAIVLSTGNYLASGAHASGRLLPGGKRTLAWRVDQADITPNELEIWYSGNDSLIVELSSPDGREVVRAGLGEDCPVLAGGVSVGHVYHRLRDPNNGDNHVDMFLKPPAPGGVWGVTLIGDDVVDGKFDAWVERDIPCPRCDSRFEPKDVDSRSTTGSIANGFRTIAVGAYGVYQPPRPNAVEAAKGAREEPLLEKGVAAVPEGEREAHVVVEVAQADEAVLAPALGAVARLTHLNARAPAHFSSCGPTRDYRQKPDLCAPGDKVLVQTTRVSGTSFAAPHVTGTIALMFEAAQRPLHIQETRKLLLSSASAAAEDVDPMRVGAGYLDIERAVAFAKAVGETPSADGALPEEPSETLPRAAGRPQPLIDQAASVVAAEDERIDEEECSAEALMSVDEESDRADFVSQISDGSDGFADFGALLVELADEAVGSGRVREAAHLIATVAPGDAPAGISAASLFDALSRLRADGGPKRALEVIAQPGEPLADLTLRPGDILLRRAFGEEPVTHVAMLVTGELFAESQLPVVGLRAERSPFGTRPGLYVQVIDGGAFPHRSRDKFARRLGDPSGRLTPDSLVLRIHRSSSSPLAECRGTRRMPPDGGSSLESPEWSLFGQIMGPFPELGQDEIYASVPGDYSRIDLSTERPGGREPQAEFVYVDVGCWVGDPGGQHSRRDFGLVYGHDGVGFAAVCRYVGGAAAGIDINEAIRRAVVRSDRPPIDWSLLRGFLVQASSEPRKIITFEGLDTQDKLLVLLGDLHLPVWKRDRNLPPPAPILTVELAEQIYRSLPQGARSGLDSLHGASGRLAHRDWGLRYTDADIFAGAGDDLCDFLRRLEEYEEGNRGQLHFVQTGDMYELWIGLPQYFEPDPDPRFHGRARPLPNMRDAVSRWIQSCRDANVVQGRSLVDRLHELEVRNKLWIYGNHDNYLRALSPAGVTRYMNAAPLWRGRMNVHIEHGHSFDANNRDNAMLPNGLHRGWLATQAAFLAPDVRYVYDGLVRALWDTNRNAALAFSVRAFGRYAERYSDRALGLFAMAHTHHAFLSRIRVCQGSAGR